MARTIENIRAGIKASYVEQRATYNLPYDNPEEWSLYNIKRLFVYICAAAIYLHEAIFDTFKADVNTIIANLKPHSERWYATMAKLYQHGFELKADSDTYDNTGLTDDQVKAAQVVKYSAVQEQQQNNGRIQLRIKLAGTDGADLSPLTDEQLHGVTEYFHRIKDAGVPLNITTGPADGLRLDWRIYYDPLVLDGTGARLDGANNTPVQDAIKAYLKNLPFNGWMVLQYVEDAVQQVDGIVICKIVSCQTQYGLQDYITLTDVKYSPDAGYVRFIHDNDLTIQYIPQSVIQ